MSSYALIKDNVVINTIAWNGTLEDLITWGAGSFHTAVNIDGIYCGIGFTYDGTNFTDPNAPQPPTNAELYKDELSSLNSQYKADISALQIAWSSAGLFDGTSEATKKTQLQAAAITRKTQNLADIEALKTKYGV
ncbi:hypothetical protein [Enterobacter kobei]|uniref:hypothetical protein n=1 Tax=Enterobacter kobei TaxID=208224 RepID=UPI0023AF2A6E|nr:hypothetical protein [Enterobacter kobei]MDE7915319.1 hypothetical protein [Enterobacter kobei]